MSNLDPVILSLIYLFFGCILGVISTIFVEKVMVAHRQFKIISRDFAEIIFNLFSTVKDTDFPDTDDIVFLVEDSFPDINRVFRKLGLYLNGNRGKKITKAYYKYKYIDKTINGLPSVKNNFVVYGFNESDMQDSFGKRFKFKTGKDLLLNNLQQIINLTK